MRHSNAATRRTQKREQAEARPLERPEVLADIDVAAAVGLMPDAVVSPAPSWCTEQYAQMVREAQVGLLSLPSDDRQF